MKIAVALVLIAGVVGWALLATPEGLQMASADAMPRQISQLSR